MKLGSLTLDYDIGTPVQWDNIQLTYTDGKVTKVELSFATLLVKVVNISYTGNNATGVEIIYSQLGFKENLTISYIGDIVDTVNKNEEII
jgi:hypothetical protein